MQLVIKRNTMHHRQPREVELFGSRLLLQFAWKTPTCLQMVANFCRAKQSQGSFLVQGPLCDTSHLATGSNHSPTGWEICISYSPGGCQEVKDWSPGLKLFVLLTTQLYLSTPLITSLLCTLSALC